MNLRTRVTVVLATVAVAAVTAFPAESGASPIDDKRRQAAELQRQIDANDHQIVTLSEQLNGARYRIQQAEAAIAEAQRRTDAAIARRKKIRAILGRRAAQIYMGAGSSTPLSQMDVSNINQLSTRSKYASAAADRDNGLIAELQRAQEELDARKADLERQRAAAKAEESAAISAKSKIESANQQKQALKSQVSGEIATLLQQEQQARAAAQQRAAQAGPPRTASDGSRRGVHPAELPERARHRTAGRGRGRLRQGAGRQGLPVRDLGSRHLRLLRPHRRGLGTRRREPRPLLGCAVPGDDPHRCRRPAAR